MQIEPVFEKAQQHDDMHSHTPHTHNIDTNIHTQKKSILSYLLELFVFKHTK